MCASNRDRTPDAHGTAHGGEVSWAWVSAAVAGPDCARLREVRHVRLIGPPRIEAADGDVLEVKGQKPWAVLARILLADRPLTRRELAADLAGEAIAGE